MSKNIQDRLGVFAKADRTRARIISEMKISTQLMISLNSLIMLVIPPFIRISCPCSGLTIEAFFAALNVASIEITTARTQEWIRDQIFNLRLSNGSSPVSDRM